MEHPFCPNGANVVYRDCEGRFLVVQDIKTGMWQLPGGGVEVSESFLEAATREFFEETGKTTFECELTLIGEFAQKARNPRTEKIVDGHLHFYLAETAYGEIRTEANSEIGRVCFMYFEEILWRYFKGEFNVAYVRLMLHYYEWLHSKGVRVVGRLAAKIEETLPEAWTLS